MKTRERTRCEGCGERIAPGAPDVLLANLLADSDQKRVYHEGCVEAAVEVLAEECKEGGQVFVLHRRTASFARGELRGD
jgi:hypothetical protein